MDKNIFEEGPRRGHAAGDTSLEQQASQLASDIKYKARQKMKGTSGSNMSPGQVQQLYRQLLNASPAPGGVKAIVKKKLFGEQVDLGITPVSEHVKDSASYVFTKVFLEGADQKFVIRVTDKATGNTSYRKADRAKVAELRANPNISSVEITGRKEGDPTDDEKSGGKKAKRDYDGDGKVESGSKEHAGVVHNAIQRKKGGVADGQDTRKEEYIDEDSRRMSNKQHTARVRSNIKSFGSNYTPPNNYDPDANRGQGEVLTRKQIEKKRRKALRQEEVEVVDEGLSGERYKAALKKGKQYSRRVSADPEKRATRGGRGGESDFGAGDRGAGNKSARRAGTYQEEVIYEKEEKGEKKIDVMKKGETNNVVVNPVSEEIKAKLDALKAEKLQEQEDAMKQQQNAEKQKEKEAQLAKQNERKEQQAKQKMMLVLRSKMRALRGGADITASHHHEGETISEGEGAVRYCPKCDKDETRDECRYGGEYWDENSKPAKGEDPRSMPTKINLAKNKLRAMGLKMSYDMEGESIDEVTYPSDFKKGSAVATPRKGRPQQHDQKTDKYGRRKTVDESAEDRLRDQRMERGGVDGNTRYDRAPKAPNTKKFGTGKTMAQKEMEKKYGKGATAMDIVKAQIRAKHGKGAIKD